MRYIHDIFTPTVGVTVDNDEFKEHISGVLDRAPFDDATQAKLRESVAYFLMGDRRRQSIESWKRVKSFQSRAAAFERSVDDAAAQITRHVREATAGKVQFDAILTTTSTGSLMPSISYRIAAGLSGQIRPDTMMIDLAHVGCTGGVKLLNLVNQLDAAVKHCLVVSLEFPTTLINEESPDVDVWQGNCTFGDGGAALWISNDPDCEGPGADGSLAGASLAVEDVKYRQHAEEGLGLIRWGYSDYYSFRLADESTFNRDVRNFVTQSMKEVDAACLESSQWAIHPAGLALLMRISRRVGLSKRAMRASSDHYQQFSNMSSAGVLHVLRDVARGAEPGSDINICTMGAGFNVIYGRVRKRAS